MRSKLLSSAWLRAWSRCDPPWWTTNRKAPLTAADAQHWPGSEAAKDYLVALPLHSDRVLAGTARTKKAAPCFPAPGRPKASWESSGRPKKQHSLRSAAERRPTCEGSI